MTDNEIMKGLRCVSGEEIFCKDCAYGNKVFTFACKKNIAIEALDLINRQRAEIERLNETLDNIIRFLPACTDCEGKTPYGERTEKCVFEIDPSYCGKKAYELFVKMRTELETVKAEAIKEFAERLKEKMLHVEDEGQIFKMVHCYEIDNLVKEMVGENK